MSLIFLFKSRERMLGNVFDLLVYVAVGGNKSMFVVLLIRGRQSESSWPYNTYDDKNIVLISPGFKGI
jgi:hypothetical protein